MEEICRRGPLSRCGRTHGLKLATWCSVDVRLGTARRRLPPKVRICAALRLACYTGQLDCRSGAGSASPSTVLM